jgi:hypothetical protein
MATVSPWPMVRSTPRTASTDPYDLVRPVNTMAVEVVGKDAVTV